MTRFALVITLFLAGCGESVQDQADPVDTAMTEEAPPTIQQTWGNNGNDDLSIFQDTETGCEYLASWRGGVTPRLTAEGRPLCNSTGATL